MLSELTGNRGTHSNDSKCSLGERGDLGISLWRGRYLRMDCKSIHISSFECLPQIIPQLFGNSFLSFNLILDLGVCMWYMCGYGICTCLCVAMHAFLYMETERIPDILPTTVCLILLRCVVSPTVDLGWQAASYINSSVSTNNIGVMGMHGLLVLYVNARNLNSGPIAFVASIHIYWAISMLQATFHSQNQLHADNLLYSWLSFQPNFLLTLPGQ